MAVTLFREGVDDIRRWQRDEEVNSQKYKRLIRGKDHNIGTEYVSSSKLKVGDLVSFFLKLIITKFIINKIYNLGVGRKRSKSSCRYGVTKNY